MQLQLSQEDLAMLHRIVEGYLGAVRTAFGRAEAGSREMLADEQQALEHILNEIHALGVSH